MTLGEKIEFYRKRKKISRPVLAAKIGVAQVTIQKYETGERTPNTNKIIDLAKALDVDPAVFLDGVNVWESDPVEDKRVRTRLGILDFLRSIGYVQIDRDFQEEMITFENEETRETIILSNEDVRVLENEITQHTKYFMGYHRNK